ncbi:MAG: ABC transporter permease [Bacteroidota bacterium]|nr:ABC transporter permease [Bacteroidota bacterium]
MHSRENRTASYRFENETLIIGGFLTFRSIEGLLQYYERKLREYSGRVLTINLNDLEEADSGGISAIHYIREHLIKQNIEVQIEGGNSQIRRQLKLFSGKQIQEERPSEKTGFFERMGNTISFVFKTYIYSYLEIASEITYWSIVDLFRKNTFRKGEVVNQSVLMGVNAAFIVGAMSFIIGLVLALQSAAQLRTFGANIYIVDLTVIAMMSEMGPLITAIMVAGRSGSSIAAELATMKVTSETDALKTMGLHPVRFVVVPKMYGGMLTMPLLTILGDIMGILGGMLIAMGYLDISPLVFFHRMEESLYLKDIIFGVIKSLVFSYLIVITGSYFGLQSQKGASEVGKVTTNAVVVSISLVILADSIMGLLIY